MPRIVAIVEGHGEVAAVPALIRRIAAEVAPELPVEIPKPIRRPASKLLHRPEELEKDLELAIATAGADGAVLLLLDCEDAPPCQLGPELSRRAALARPDFGNIFTSLAFREFESWFLAAAESLAGRRKLAATLQCPSDFEHIRDAKGWLTDNMTGSAVYQATVDQVALCQIFDMEMARGRSHSFNRFWRICTEMFASIR
jgi:hypothetical protein